MQRLVFLLAALLVPSLAAAEPPRKMGSSVEDYIRSAYAGNMRTMTIAAAAETVVAAPGDLSVGGIQDQWCVPLRSSIVVTCRNAWATICFSQTATISMNTTYRGHFTDIEGASSGTDLVGPASGAGLCFHAPQDTPVERIVPHFDDNTVGARHGYCDTGNGGTYGWPCDDDAADCGTSGACLTPTIGTNRGRPSCAFIIGMGDGTTGPVCHFENPR